MNNRSIVSVVISSFASLRNVEVIGNVRPVGERQYMTTTGLTLVMLKEVGATGKMHPQEDDLRFVS